jgi:serine/threonine protein kinase
LAVQDLSKLQRADNFVRGKRHRCTSSPRKPLSMANLHSWDLTSSLLSTWVIQAPTGNFIPCTVIEKFLSKNKVCELLTDAFPKGIPGQDFERFPNKVIGPGLNLFAAIVMAQKWRMIKPLLEDSLFSEQVQLPCSRLDVCLERYHFDPIEIKALNQQLTYTSALKIRFRDSINLETVPQPLPFLEETPLAETSLGKNGAISYVTVCADHLVDIDNFTQIPAVDDTLNQDNATYSHSHKRLTSVEYSKTKSTRKPEDTKEYVRINRVILVRKTIRRSKGPNEDIEAEIRALLEVKNPCVVPLLFWYTTKFGISLLFPRYTMSLKTYLSFNQEILWKSSEYIEAMEGLWGGLHALHEIYSGTQPGFTKIGSHNDLRPDNIMVDVSTEESEHPRKRLVIIDLGFAKIKNPVETSKDWAQGHEQGKSYAAPEIIRNLDESSSARKRDIWALGCIMVEILVHVGPERLTSLEFAKDRRQREHGIANTWFHSQDGNDHCRRVLHPTVVQKLGFLCQNSDQALGKTAGYILTILLICPVDRPSAEEVAKELRNITNSTNSVTPEIAPCDDLPASPTRSGDVPKAVSLDITSKPTAPQESQESQAARSQISPKDTTYNPLIAVDLPHDHRLHVDTSVAVLACPSSASDNLVTQNLPNVTNVSSVQIERPAQQRIPKSSELVLNSSKDINRLYALRNSQELKAWAKSNNSDVLLAYDSPLHTAPDNKTLIWNLMNRMINQEDPSTNMLKIYHFCSPRESVAAVTASLLAQVPSQFRNKHQTSSKATESDHIMRPFINLCLEIAKCRPTVVFVHKLDRCGQGFELLLPPVTAIRAISDSAVFKLFVTVTDNHKARIARQKWELDKTRMLYNQTPSRGDVEVRKESLKNPITWWCT